MRITPVDVHDQRFRVTFRGFDPVEVDTFLQRVADELERVIEERESLRGELDQEKRARRTLEEAIAASRSMHEQFMESARAEAEVAIHQAQLRADRILAEANEELLRLRREIQPLRERRSLFLAELGSLAQTLLAWSEDAKAGPEPGPGLIEDPPPAEPTDGGASADP